MTRLGTRGLLVCAVAALVAGCTTGASVRPPRLMLPEAVSTELTAPEPVATSPWWRDLDDPEITALVERALAQHPDALQAAAQIDAARAQRAQSLAAFGLTGAVEGNAQWRHTDLLKGEPAALGAGAPSSGAGAGSLAPGAVEGRERSAGVSAGFAWEIDLFQRAAAVREAGDATLAAAVANSAAARLAVAAAVADAVYELRSLRSQLADAEAFERLQRELDRYVRARQAAGVGNRAEVERAAARTAQLQANAIRLGAEMRAADRRLRNLTRSHTGESPVAVSGTGMATGPTTLAASLPEAPRQLPSDLLLRRPDVQAAHRRYLAQAARLRSADKELLPRLILQPGVSFLTLREPVRSDSVTSFIGLRVSAPLFDRTRLLAALREEGANAELAVIELERVVDRAFSEADQALTLYRAELQRLPALTDAERLAERVRSSAATLFQANLVDARTVLDAERDWREARAAAVDARFLAARRRVDTFRAVGGGWTGPID